MILKYAGYGLLEVNDDVVRLTRKGRLLSNVIFRELV
jgi:coproporphyrinogen III oxidase-like Fe-S oxidoreductase